MNVTKTVKETLVHPVVSVVGGVAALGSLFPIPVLDALMETVWVNAGTLFAGVSLSASQGWVPELAVVAVGALYLGRIIDQLTDAFLNQLDDEND